MFKANLVMLALLFALTLALPTQPSRARVLPTPTVTALTNIPAADMITLTSSPTITEPDADPVTTFRAALARSSWPASLHHDLETIATCESRLEAHQVGDGGLAFGWLQIRADYHPRSRRVTRCSTGHRTSRLAGPSTRPLVARSGRGRAGLGHDRALDVEGQRTPDGGHPRR